MIKIYPYKVGSASVKKLKKVLGATIIKTEDSRYVPKEEHIVVNWGNSKRPENLVDTPIFNEPEAVAVASNKLLTLQRLLENDVMTVPFTTDWEVASDWDVITFVRHKLTGHSGEGIEVFEGDMALPRAPLYTYGIENHGEYRVHVFDGEVILYQKKSRRVNEETGEVITAEGAEADVRNLASNWIYRTGDLRRLEHVEELAVRAVAALGLDFGAVDIIKDEKGDVFVLEVNTAPGLGNESTLQAYTNAFNSLIS